MTDVEFDFPPIAATLSLDELLAGDVAASQAVVATWVEQALNHFFAFLEQQQSKEQPWSHGKKPSLLSGARYALLNDGGKNPAKRLRPWFLFLAAAAMGQPLNKFYHLALSIELIHGYSLVHDDLPAMDNDAMRRGKPTLHRAFLGDLSAKDNEAFAILVGDLLQGLAFELLAMDGATAPADKNTLLLHLARAAGFGGMVSGQWRDIVGATTIDDAKRLKAQKTGALIELCLTAPLLITPPDNHTATLWHGVARQVGLLYQAVDDMMDEVATAGAMGKQTGKDRAAGKSTTIALQGLSAARREINDWLAQVESGINQLKTTSDGDGHGDGAAVDSVAANPIKNAVAVDLLLTWLKTMIQPVIKI
ncbi:MAG: polyprenyl synthetase family protein [Hydrotalea sp.]|nr:polyprenyl synthetase family protein [Hydrotalea sp.]